MSLTPSPLTFQYTVATVKETQQTWSAEDDFIVEKNTLQLDIRGPKNLIVDQAFGLEIKMINPLNKYLTDCRLTIEAPGFNAPRTVRIKDIGPKEQFVHIEELGKWRSSRGMAIDLILSGQNRAIPIEL